MFSRLLRSYRNCSVNVKNRLPNSASWPLTPLEPRLLLAADVAAPLATAPDGAGSEIASGGESPDALTASRCSVQKIVFIDSDVSDAELLAVSVDDGDVVLLQPDHHPFAQISKILASRCDVAAIHLLGHGQSGQIQLGGIVVDEAYLRANTQQVVGWRRALTADCDILIYGCETGAGREGQRLVSLLAEITGADVAASIDRTGASSAGGNWELERVFGNVESELAVGAAARDQYQHTLPISIQAAGATGAEQMALQIDGSTVQTWSNIGGDFNAGVFQTFTYAGGTGVTGDRVRVVFTNDLYNPGVVDRNLRVDSIKINGVTEQSEDSRVYSTGTWEPADGITPGFRQSEILHSNGYFQYFNGGNTSGSQITIRAAGNEGGEQFNLKINGNTVGSYTVTKAFQTFSYQAVGTVNADQVRLEFTNDQWIPGIYDRNLIVDNVNIDGTTFQTENPSVYSTGTWLPADGIAPGFRRSETLHTNGYFQYAATHVDFTQPSVVVLENGEYSGQYLRLDSASGNVVLATTVDAYSQWRVTTGSTGSLLQNVETGQFLDAVGTSNGGNVDVSNIRASRNDWMIADAGGNFLTLRNTGTGGYLHGDSASQGWNVEQSPSVSSDEYWRPIIVDRTAPDIRFRPNDDTVSFAAFGDYGTQFKGTPQVVNLVNQLGPDIIVTLGDARYDNETYGAIHAPFSDYLNGASGDGGTGDINRFFPTAGNHDYTDSGGISQFLDYFALPGAGVPTPSNTGSELTYDFVWGPVQFFVIDSQAFLNDASSSNAQTAWLHTALQASQAQWQVVLFHHPPHSSGDLGASPELRLPFAAWGADLVLNGHNHNYERIDLNGISYVINGLGGEDITGFKTPVRGSVVRYNGDFGLNLFTATSTQIIGSFISVDGVTRDSFVINAS